MKGAHRLDCLEGGPDLVVSEVCVDVPAFFNREQAIARIVPIIEFVCGSCGQRWRWAVRLEADGGIAYGPAVRLERQR